MYILFFLILRNHISFLSNVPHIIKLKFQKIKNTARVPPGIKLAKKLKKQTSKQASKQTNKQKQKTKFFLIISAKLQDLVICFEICGYFLASENDEWGFGTTKNYGREMACFFDFLFHKKKKNWHNFMHFQNIS